MFKNRNHLVPLLTIALLSFAISCGGSSEQANATRPTTARPNTNSPTANAAPPAVIASGNQTDSAAIPADGFSVEDVCTLPQDVVDSPFSGLGGGNWEKWDDAGGGLSYSCTGGRDSIKLEDVIAKISGRYSALGDKASVQVVSATYIALQYGGETPVEGPLRQKFVEFCDSLARKFYGQPLPDKFRRRLTDEATYSESASSEEYTEKVGKGMLSLSARKEKSDLIRLEVNFFPNEAAYKKFKES